jgi:hypothetical protein
MDNGSYVARIGCAERAIHNRVVHPIFQTFLSGGMADRNALRLIGLLLGAATMFVVSVGAMVVTKHLGGPLQLADNAHTVAAPVKAQ